MYSRKAQNKEAWVISCPFKRIAAQYCSDSLHSKRRCTAAAAQSSGWMAIHSMSKCMTSSPNFFLISYKWPVPSSKSFLDSTEFCGILHLILKPKPLRILIHFNPGSADCSRSQAKLYLNPSKTSQFLTSPCFSLRYNEYITLTSVVSYRFIFLLRQEV